MTKDAAKPRSNDGDALADPAAAGRSDSASRPTTRPTSPAGWVSGFYPIYAQAQKAYGVNWLLIASVHKQETAFSTHPTTYHGLNFANCCAGPMQFNVTNGVRGGIGSTWARYKNASAAAKRPATYPHRTAKHPSVYDDYDAIMAAAALLRDSGAGANLDASAWRAAYDYYGHDATGVDYADEVVARAIGWGQKDFCINCGTDASMMSARRRRLGRAGPDRARRRRGRRREGGAQAPRRAGRRGVQEVGGSRSGRAGAAARARACPRPRGPPSRAGSRRSAGPGSSGRRSAAASSRVVNGVAPRRAPPAAARRSAAGESSVTESSTSTSRRSPGSRRRRPDLDRPASGARTWSSLHSSTSTTRFGCAISDGNDTSRSKTSSAVPFSGDRRDDSTSPWSSIRMIRRSAGTGNTIRIRWPSSSASSLRPSGEKPPVWISTSSPSARTRSMTNPSTRTSARSPGTASRSLTAACSGPSRSSPIPDRTTPTGSLPCKTATSGP